MIHLEEYRHCDIVPDAFEVPFAEQVNNVLFRSCEQIVKTNDIVSCGNETVAQMRTQESCAAGDKNTLHGVATSYQSSCPVD